MCSISWEFVVGMVGGWEEWRVGEGKVMDLCGFRYFAGLI